jgi:ABC-type transport system involved in multi-copper enzyme maturation permease subunit
MATRADKKTKIKIIYKYSLLEIIKEKYLLMLVALFFLSVALAFYLSEFSAVNKDISFEINLSSLYYFALSFWVIISIPIIFSREIENNFFMVIVSKPISIWEYILGKYFSYLSVIFVYLFFAFIFSVLFGFGAKSSLVYYLGVFLEVSITIMAGIFFALNFKPINAVIFTFMFFFISHSTYEIAKTAIINGNKSLIYAAKFFYYLFPSYDYYDFSGYLVYNELPSVNGWFLVGYTFFYVLFIFSLCLVTFYKRR